MAGLSGGPEESAAVVLSEIMYQTAAPLSHSVKADGREPAAQAKGEPARRESPRRSPLACAAGSRPTLTPVSDADLRAAWEAAANPQLAALTADDRPGIVDVPEQWLVLVTCRDEKQQVELLERFRREGVEGRALVS